MPYFTLVSRLKGTKTWGIEFGSKEREDVVFERDAIKEDDKRNGFKVQHRILKTKTSSQSEIDKAIVALNAKG